jgi:hypothetical protein
LLDGGHFNQIVDKGADHPVLGNDLKQFARKPIRRHASRSGLARQCLVAILGHGEPCAEFWLASTQRQPKARAFGADGGRFAADLPIMTDVQPSATMCSMR